MGDLWTPQPATMGRRGDAAPDGALGLYRVTAHDFDDWCLRHGFGLGPTPLSTRAPLLWLASGERARARVLGRYRRRRYQR